MSELFSTGVFEKDYYIGLTKISPKRNITNKSILEFMEDIAARHCATFGLGFNDTYKTHLSWILIDWKLKVITYPSYDSIVHIKTWEREITKLYVFRDFEMYDENGNLCAIATSKWLLYDVAKNSFSKIPTDFCEKYGLAYDKKVFDKNSDVKLKEPTSSPIFSKEYTILRRDIDLNKHMHNLYYLDLAYEVLPEDIYNEEKKNIDILYKKEIKLRSNSYIIFI